MRPPPLRRSLGGKLLVAQLLVILAGSVTLVAVALQVAPAIFHHHVREALGVVPDSVMRHLDSAFGDALLISLAVAVGAAAATAAAVSWLLAARTIRPIRTLAAASRRVAQGSYGERVTVASNDELGALATAFNEMAGALESTEQRRRELRATSRTSCGRPWRHSAGTSRAFVMVSSRPNRGPGSCSTRRRAALVDSSMTWARSREPRSASSTCGL